MRYSVVDICIERAMHASKWSAVGPRRQIITSDGCSTIYSSRTRSGALIMVLPEYHLVSALALDCPKDRNYAVSFQHEQWKMEEK